MAASKQIDTRPWWQEPYTWLVISGPASVVVACIITWIFIQRAPDALVAEDYYKQGIEINKTLEAAPATLQPAVLARNHSATGGKK